MSWVRTSSDPLEAMAFSVRCYHSGRFLFAVDHGGRLCSLLITVGFCIWIDSKACFQFEYRGYRSKMPLAVYSRGMYRNLPQSPTRAILMWQSSESRDGLEKQEPHDSRLCRFTLLNTRRCRLVPPAFKVGPA